MFELTHRNRYPVNTYNPFREMEALERRFFTPFMEDFFRSDAMSQFRTDVTDEGDHFLLESDLPGFDKKDIRLELNGDTLMVKAERRSKTEQKEKDKIVRMERTYGSYSRSYDLTGIDAEAIKAKYENGVLQLILPKKEQLPPASRQINIE